MDEEAFRKEYLGEWPPAKPIEVGDHVYVRGGRVHWVVVGIKSGRATLCSGMTGRHSSSRVEELTLHTKGEKNGAHHG